MSRLSASKGLRSKAICSAIVIGVLGATVPIATQTASSEVFLPSLLGHCSWATATAARRYTPAERAQQVLKRMTLTEKIGEVELNGSALYENKNAGVPRLCIPPLTLQDGPNGIATGNTGVTQLPASIGVAASFDLSVAYDYGRVLGAEARDQGIDVVQAPNLNLARLPNTGRIYEGYGEDPNLVSAMGVADIEGIQSESVMADAKHFTAYTQETARIRVDQIVSNRALNEVYFAPFEAAVEQAHVASLMCAFGQINHVYTCQDDALFDVLRNKWGFSGFVRSDLGAVTDPVAAFKAGLDLIKPAVPGVLLAAVRDGELPIGRLNNAVLSILTEMFAYGLIADPLTGRTHVDVRTPSHLGVALSTAERSIVLLKDENNVLPLDKAHLRSVAVIGQDAGANAMTAGYGSARVVAPFVVTALEAIRHWLGRKATVSFSPGGPVGPTKTATLGSAVADLPILNKPGVVTAAVATAIAPGTGPGWVLWRGTIDPRTNGLYDFSVETEGDTWVYLDGTPFLSEPGLHDPAPWSTTLSLIGGHRYSIEVRWFATRAASLQRTGTPQLSWTDVSPMIAAAVRTAHHASVAIVFANDFNEEGFDRPSLSLPSDLNALISEVAAANPRTVVVLNTGGAVLMPWLSKVAGVLEAWYPGEEDGAATLAVLSGAVDPSGHLPVTFPRSDAKSPLGEPSFWPGIDSAVFFDGLAIGYRYYDVNGIYTLFPFGYGLSYTTFSISNPTAVATADGYRVHVEVANIGHRAGRAVVEAYLSYPTSADEPPRELKAFASIRLVPGQARAVTLTLPQTAFETYLDGHFHSVPGAYTLSIGQSERNLPLTLTLTVP